MLVAYYAGLVYLAAHPKQVECQNREHGYPRDENQMRGIKQAIASLTQN